MTQTQDVLTLVVDLHSGTYSFGPETTLHRDSIEGFISRYLSDRMRDSPDRTTPANRPAYHIRLVRDGAAYVCDHDCLNEGLLVGLLVAVLRRLSS